MPNYRYNRRRNRTITGRFYVFLTILVIVIVLAVVLIKKHSSPATPITPTPSSTEYPITDQPDPSEIPSPTTLPETDPQPVAVTDLSVRQDLPTDWKNFLLLGSDSRDMKTISLCDAIIIASINTTTGQIKMTSIMRDTVVPIPDRGDQKINSTASFGGLDLMMKVINENFGMNITEYAVVNFQGMAQIIDILGGVYCNITQQEQEIIDRHIGEIAQYMMSREDYLAQRDELRLKTYGSNKKLTGIQAVTYARIREIGDDYARTDRQKAVMQSIIERVKDANAIQILQLVNQVWQHVQTNISMPTAIDLTKTMINAGIKTPKTSRLPANNTFKNETRKSLGAALYDVDFAQNTLHLHDFIYESKVP